MRRCGYDGFFSGVIEAGAHQAALRMVIDGMVDASAIDSTVLELELRRYPELSPRIRVIETFGPSPVPPAVISRRVPAALRQKIRHALLEMHRDGMGREVLDVGAVARFTRVTDADYDPIRQMAREGTSVRWTPTPLPPWEG